VSAQRPAALAGFFFFIFIVIPGDRTMPNTGNKRAVRFEIDRQPTLEAVIPPYRRSPQRRSSNLTTTSRSPDGGTFVNGTLELWNLRFAIADAIVGGVKLPGADRRQITEDEVVDRLWREAASTVRHVFREIANKRPLAYDDYWLPEPVTKAGRTKARRRLMTRNKIGLTVSAIAERCGMSVTTLKSLLVHHGYLELTPYGSRRRLLVTRSTFSAGYGHNAAGTNRVGRVEGYGKSMPFPVFYEEHLADIMWTLDYPGIVNATAALPSKRKRLAWLTANHDYLPNEEIARLVGCNPRAVERAKAKRRSCVINREALTEARSMVHRSQLTGRSIKLPTWALDRTATGPNIKAAAA
jgi:hypothetical protein